MALLLATGQTIFTLIYCVHTSNPLVHISFIAVQIPKWYAYSHFKSKYFYTGQPKASRHCIHYCHQHSLHANIMCAHKLAKKI